MFVMSTGALYHYGGPKSASDIGTPGTPQIASVLGTGPQNRGVPISLLHRCRSDMGTPI